MTTYTRIENKFAGYTLADCDCEWCLFRRRKSKYRRAGCKLERCCCEEERRDAAAREGVEYDDGGELWRE